MKHKINELLIHASDFKVKMRSNHPKMRDLGEWKSEIQKHWTGGLQWSKIFITVYHHYQAKYKCRYVSKIEVSALADHLLAINVFWKKNRQFSSRMLMLRYCPYYRVVIPPCNTSPLPLAQPSTDYISLKKGLLFSEYLQVLFHCDYF